MTIRTHIAEWLFGPWKLALCKSIGEDLQFLRARVEATEKMIAVNFQMQAGESAQLHELISTDRKAMAAQNQDMQAMREKLLAQQRDEPPVPARRVARTFSEFKQAAETRPRS